MINVKAVLFDFDGTLAVINIDFPQMRKSILEIIVSCGVAPDGLTDLFALEMVEAGRKIIAQQKPGREEAYLRETAELIRDIEMQGAKDGSIFSGVKPMLTKLKDRGRKTGIVTRNCLEAVTALFPDIDRFCDVVITRETAGRVKPHPDHLLTALGHLGIAPESAAIVGDHPMDIHSGKAAGVFTIGVLTGYGSRDSLRQAGADLILQNAAEILEYLPENHF